MRSHLCLWTFAAILNACVSPVEQTPTENANQFDCDGAKCDAVHDSDSPRVCAAVRGNGELIAAHFGALARITELHGLLDGAAGGSSASITIFLTESIYMNPLLRQCGDSPCTEIQTRLRASLLFKSLQGYFEMLGDTEEGAAIRGLAPLARRIKDEGIEAIAQDDPEAAAQRLLSLLESDDLRTLVNPELLSTIRNSSNVTFHVSHILDGIRTFGRFDASDPIIAVRPGLIDFGAVADRLGRVGSFYAGYGPFDRQATERFLHQCAEPGESRPWSSIRDTAVDGTTCGDLFLALASNYRQAFLAAGDKVRSRIDDPVGQRLPALVTTSVLTGSSADAARAAHAQYLEGAAPSPAFDFDDVRFGYWGRDSDLVRVQSSMEQQQEPLDLKSQRFLALGATTWRTALSYSPAEPGLARFLPIDDQYISAGGWSDLHPVQVLEHMGCDKVIYVTRTGGESQFAEGIARLLGMDDEERQRLYDLDNRESSYSQAIRRADAVLCTDWDAIPATDLERLVMEGYTGLTYSKDPYFGGGDFGIVHAPMLGCGF